MSPILITPETDVLVSPNLAGLENATPTNKPFIVEGVVFVRPCGQDNHHTVKVTGFPEEQPGGTLETERLTADDKPDTIAITTREDRVLYEKLGVESINIDGNDYKAVNCVTLQGIEPWLAE